MQYEIRKYPVRHPLLKKYIRFFWEFRADQLNLNHKIIPQRNINLRFNLNETPQFISSEGKDQILEDVFFSGLQDHFSNRFLKMNGKVDVLGICFLPEGFYPFVKIPVNECKNLVLGSQESGLKMAGIIKDKLKETIDINARLTVLEIELVRLISNEYIIPDNFHRLFNALRQNDNPTQLHEFCQRNNIGLRKLERMFNKYVGVSALTYSTLNRFQNSLNQLLYSDYSKLSDIAYGNGYFDQMHFIKDFKRFAGNTPKNFVNQNNSMLQIGRLK